VKNIKDKIMDLLSRRSCTVFHLLSGIDESIGDVADCLSSLLKEGLIAVSCGQISVAQRDTDDSQVGAGSSEQRDHARDKDGLKGRNQKPRDWSELLPLFKDLTARRPAPLTDYDQGYVTPESVMRRIVLLDERQDLDGARVLLLGDDDLTSVALALTGKPLEIVALDIDTRLLDFINDVKTRLSDLGFSPGSKLRTIRHDLRHELPVDLRRNFTVVVSDPLETRNGFAVFMRRALEALSGPGSTLLLGLTDLECSREKWRAFQMMLLKAGFVIRDIVRDCQQYVLPDDTFIFREYPPLSTFRCSDNAGVLWYHSSLVRLTAVKAPDPSALEIDPDADIYLDLSEKSLS